MSGPLNNILKQYSESNPFKVGEIINHAKVGKMSALIGSFNMSFTSDQGLIFGSEKHFIENKLKKYNDKKENRAVWLKAAERVKDFMTGEGFAIGLQEMNDWEWLNAKAVREGKPAKAYPAGIQHIINMFDSPAVVADCPSSSFSGISPVGKYGKTQDDKYSFAYNGIDQGFGKPCLLTVWKTEIFGDFESMYFDDLGNTSPFVAENTYTDLLTGQIKNFKQPGRPIMIIKTTKGFSLINLHGPNFTQESLPQNNLSLTREGIQAHFNKYKEGKDITHEKVFIMGDFNDPHGSIRTSRPLDLDGKKYIYNTDDSLVKSCCYNFNSSCPDDFFYEDMEVAMKDNGDGYTSYPHECKIKRSTDAAISEDLNGTVKDMTERGKLENYQFVGDYVLGMTPVKGLSFYKPEIYAQTSDHEMVVAEFAIPTVGGRRRKSKKTQRKVHRKSKKTQRKAKKVHRKSKKTQRKAKKVHRKAKKTHRKH